MYIYGLSDKRIASKIYKNLLKLIIIKASNPIKNDKKLNRHFTLPRTYVDGKFHVYRNKTQKCPLLLISRKTQS